MSKKTLPLKGDLCWLSQGSIARVYRITEVEGQVFSAVSLDDPFNRGGLFAVRVPHDEFHPYEPTKAPVKQSFSKWTGFEAPKTKI